MLTTHDPCSDSSSLQLDANQRLVQFVLIHMSLFNSTVTYGMYECWGPGANQTAQRVPWAHDFNQLEAMQYTHLDFINGQEWLAEV